MTFAENNPSIRPIFPATRQDLELRGYVNLCEYYVQHLQQRSGTESNNANEDWIRLLNTVQSVRANCESNVPWRENNNNMKE